MVAVTWDLWIKWPLARGPYTNSETTNLVGESNNFGYMTDKESGSGWSEFSTRIDTPD